MTDQRLDDLYADGACQDIPAPLLEAFSQGRVAIFAGGGVSADDTRSLKEKLTRHVAAELGVKAEEHAFPDLMEMLVSQPKGRLQLVELIKERIDNVTSFDELRFLATEFHRELATLPAVDTIVTTNWDPFFEEDCGVSAFVFAEDFAFWDVAERRVLKLNGTLNSLGSIVATRSDYRSLEARLPGNLMSSIFKIIVSMKRIVFVGYAPEDPEFLFVHDLIKRELKAQQGRAYAVVPESAPEDIARFEALGIEPVIGDHTAFIRAAKAHMQESKLYVPDSFYGRVAAVLDYVKAAHFQLYDELDMHEHPEIILCACYQDGLMHSLQRILTMRKTGAYSDRKRNYNAFESYSELQERFVREKRYDDVAYVEGYRRALFYAAVYELPEVDADPDAFFTLGQKFPIYRLEDYKKLLKDIPSMHESAYAWAKEWVRSQEGRREEGFVFHHGCWL